MSALDAPKKRRQPFAIERVARGHRKGFRGATRKAMTTGRFVT